MAHQAGAYPSFFRMKQQGVFLLPPGWMLVHHRVIPSIMFAGTHLYTWVEKGTLKVTYVAQEHKVMSLTRAQTQTALSGDKRTNLVWIQVFRSF